MRNLGWHLLQECMSTRWSERNEQIICPTAITTGKQNVETDLSVGIGLPVVPYLEMRILHNFTINLVVILEASTWLIYTGGLLAQNRFTSTCVNNERDIHGHIRSKRFNVNHSWLPDELERHKSTSYSSPNELEARSFPQDVHLFQAHILLHWNIKENLLGIDENTMSDHHLLPERPGDGSLFHRKG
jgi:hypothetical protein